MCGIARVVMAAKLGGEIGRQDQMIDQRQQLRELWRRDIFEIGDHRYPRPNAIRAARSTIAALR